MQIGEPRYENERKSKTYFNLQKGDNVFRILPPLGNMAQTGHWTKYWSIHWGYKDTKGKNRPFQSPEIKNHNTKMIEVADPAKLKIDLETARRDRLAKDLKTAIDSRNVELAKKLTEELNEVKELLKQYRLEKRYFLNAMTLDGKIGLLKIPHKAKVALDEEIKKLRARGVNPLGVNDGRFFVFSNVGVGTDTTYSVRVYEETIDVAGIGQVKKEMSHSLSNDVLSRLQAEAFELDRLYIKPSAAQVQSMVDNPSPENVELIMESLKTRNNSVDEEDVDVEEDVELSALVSPASQQAAPQAPAPTAQQTPKTLGAQAAQAPQAATVASTPAPAATQRVAAPAAQAPAPDFSSMSNEDFLKILNG
jgi:hypothetical protein